MLEIPLRGSPPVPFVGMMGDRTLGGEPVEQVHVFLGSPASFPLGPHAGGGHALRRPVYFMGGFSISVANR